MVRPRHLQARSSRCRWPGALRPATGMKQGVGQARRCGRCQPPGLRWPRAGPTRDGPARCTEGHSVARRPGSGSCRRRGGGGAVATGTDGHVDHQQQGGPGRVEVRLEKVTVATHGDSGRTGASDRPPASGGRTRHRRARATAVVPTATTPLPQRRQERLEGPSSARCGRDGGSGRHPEHGLEGVEARPARASMERSASSRGRSGNAVAPWRARFAGIHGLVTVRSHSQGR